VILVFLANLFQCSGHDLWSVVYGEDNIRHTSGGKSLDLVENHGLVAEFNERLGEGESLVVNVGQLCLDKMYLLQTYKRAKTGAKATNENEGYTQTCQLALPIDESRGRRTLHIEKCVYVKRVKREKLLKGLEEQGRTEKH